MRSRIGWSSCASDFQSSASRCCSAAQAEYLDYRDRARAFSGIAGYEPDVFDLTGGSEPARIHVERATHTLFSTLGVSPLIGRTFSAAEDDPSAARVIVLSYDFWQRRYGGRADVLGETLRLDERPYTAIGVMPPGFEFPFTAADIGEPPAAWVPIAFTREEIADRASEFPVHIVARLKPGVSIVQGHEDVERVANEFQREHPDIYTGNLRLEVFVEALGASSAARVRPILLALTIAVGFVLLIACANVTNLLLARAATRQREMAMRSALGASTRRLFGQLLIESVMLTGVGAGLGCLLAAALGTTPRARVALARGGAVHRTARWPRAVLHTGDLGDQRIGLRSGPGHRPAMVGRAYQRRAQGGRPRELDGASTTRS